MIEWIVENQQKHPRAWLAFIVVAILLTGAIASNLQIDPSFSALVGKESSYNTQDRILSNAFGRNDALIVMIEQDDQTILQNARDVTSEETLQYMEDIKEIVSTSQYVVEVNGPIIDEEERLAQLFIVLQSPETPNGFRNVLAELNGLLDQVGSPPGIDAKITGLPVLLNRVSTLLINDNLITILITLLLIIGVLYWYTKNLTYTLMTASVPIVSLIVLAAFMVIFDIQVTITLAAVGVLALGLGADYSIHIATHYLEAKRHHEGHWKALQHTLKDLKVPITASFTTTLAGFAALILGVSPSSQAQGIVLALAITIIYVLTFLLFPLLLTNFGKGIVIEENPTFEKIRKGMTKLAVYQAHHSLAVIGVILIITIIMIIGMTKVTFSTSNSNWIPDDDPIATSFREITYTFGDTESMWLVLSSTKNDLRDVQTARDAKRLTELIRAIPNVDSVSNPFEDIPYQQAQIHQVLTYDRNEQFNHDYTLTTIQIVTQNPQQDEAGDSKLLKEIRSLVNMYPVHNAQVDIYGDAVRFEELGDSLEKDAGMTTMIGLTLVFIIASLTYLSIVVGALALLPIIIAIIWALGLMGYFNVPFTSLSTGIISLVLGIGVDFSIHLVDGISRTVRKLGVEDAIKDTMKHAGSAIVLSSMTTFAGFSALTFATLLGTQRLGWSLAFSILSVFIVSITLVPAVMSVRFKKYRRNW